jgi:hypothetical protein
MANQNFVVHNGLTVGALTIDAATSNVALPVGKQLTIGNVILRDNGDGKLHIRDITDNSDAELIGTVGAISTTSGNIQIGTNHIESTNPNGPISLRPNGNGNIAFSSNTIMIGHGGAFTLVGTGIQTDPYYGINYPPTNVIFTMSAINSSGNLRLSMTTPASSTSTGALQVSGGVGVLGSLYVGGGIGADGTVGSAGQVLQSTGSGIQWAQADQIANGGSNIRVTTDWVNVSVKGSNVLSVGSASTSVTGFLNVSGNIIANSAEVGSVEAAGVIYANGTAVSTSTTSGALIVAGGAGIAGALYVGGNVVINGNLLVNGNVTTFNANNLTINDSMIYLADDNPADIIDIGFISSFTSGAGYQHTGFVRDASDGVWKLFAGVAIEPTTTVDFTGATYSSLYVGNIQTVNSANIGSTLNVAGNILGKAGTLSSLTTSGVITSTLATGTAPFTVASTTVVANLNADLWDGNHFASYLNQAVLTTSTPTFAGLTTPSITHSGTNGVGDIGGSGATFATVYATTFSGVSTTAKYADLAENYSADAAYEPGTVLEFGGDQEVTLAEEGTRKVAGVVSTNPAHLMNTGLEGENVVALALTGRVPVKVTGYIRKGDMLVSAGDGRARASAMPQIGTVIGKALQDFDGSDGVIEVVVGRM